LFVCFYFWYDEILWTRPGGILATHNHSAIPKVTLKGSIHKWLALPPLSSVVDSQSVSLSNIIVSTAVAEGSGRLRATWQQSLWQSLWHAQRCSAEQWPTCLDKSAMALLSKCGTLTQRVAFSRTRRERHVKQADLCTCLQPSTAIH
jgi:hypothetical protein